MAAFSEGRLATVASVGSIPATVEIGGRRRDDTTLTARSEPYNRGAIHTKPMAIYRIGGFHPRLGARPMRDAVEKASGDAVANELLTGGDGCG